jgi:hypothetical protein
MVPSELLQIYHISQLASVLTIHLPVWLWLVYRPMVTGGSECMRQIKLCWYTYVTHDNMFNASDAIMRCLRSTSGRLSQLQSVPCTVRCFSSFHGLLMLSMNIMPWSANIICSKPSICRRASLYLDLSTRNPANSEKTVCTDLATYSLIEPRNMLMNTINRHLLHIFIGVRGLHILHWMKDRSLSGLSCSRIDWGWYMPFIDIYADYRCLLDLSVLYHSHIMLSAVKSRHCACSHKILDFLF